MNQGYFPYFVEVFPTLTRGVSQKNLRRFSHTGALRSAAGGVWRVSKRDKMDKKEIKRVKMLLKISGG
jgi:2-keto-3-deoxy-6-phosphogluconate aldolase